MTPCEELGYKVGDRFIAKRNGGSYLKGDPLTLNGDDGTEAPYFKNERSGHNCCAHLERIEKAHGTNPHLRPGDYVSTEGMTEEQYHAVAKSFVEAGAREDMSEVFIGRPTYSFMGWSDDINMVDEFAGEPEGGRHLTIEQVLGEEEDTQTIRDARFEDGHQLRPESFGAIGAGYLLVEEEETPTIQSLLKKADKHARKAQKHEAKRKEAIEQARALLPDGWELKEKGVGDPSSIIKRVYARGEFPKPKVENVMIGNTPISEVDFDYEYVDLTDPDDWREGDVLEVVDADRNDGVKNGDLVVHNDSPGNRLPYCKKPDGGVVAFDAKRQLRFHHRP